MLTIATVRDRSGEYYLAGIDAERSLNAQDGAVARWRGQGSSDLGLDADVTPEGLATLLGARGALRNPKAVAAYDLTFSAPKSVSLLFAFSEPAVAHAVAGAQDNAVDAALRYVESHAASVRLGAGGEHEIAAVGAVAAATFNHTTSRALDPHLHTHVLVANAAFGSDQRRSTLDGRGLFAHRVAAGEVYALELRHELSQALHVGWQRTPQGRFEIEGIPTEAVGTFSGRSAEIRQHLHEHGSASSAAARIAWAATRDDKVTPTRGELLALWEARARACGLSPADVDGACGRPQRVQTGLDETRFATSLVTSPHASLTRRDVVAAWCSSVVDGVSATDAEAAVDRWLRADAVGVGVRERAFGPGRVVPARHLVTHLGPRPLSAEGQDRWRSAARSVLSYRACWGITDGRRALGIDGSPSSLATLSPRRLAQHLELVASAQELRRGQRTVEAQHLSLGR